MSDEKDEKNHLGDKLRDKKRAEEDKFIREREKAALERLRQKQQEERDKERK